MAKRNYIPLIISLVSIFVSIYLLSQKINYATRDNVVSLEDKMDSLFDLIKSNNHTIHNILDGQNRFIHYAAGHQTTEKFHFGCPECNLLMKLLNRKMDIDYRLYEIEDFINENPNHPTIPDLKKEIQDLDQEYSKIENKFYTSDLQAKKVGESIKYGKD